jgi:hypothetical protein
MLFLKKLFSNKILLVICNIYNFSDWDNGEIASPDAQS